MPNLETVAGEAAGVLGVVLSDVRVNGHRLGDRKALVVEWCCRLSDASQRAVARHVGYGSESAVGKARKRAQAALAQEPEFAEAERELLRRLSALQRVKGDNHASSKSRQGLTLMEVSSLAGFHSYFGWPQKAQKTQKRFVI